MPMTTKNRQVPKALIRIESGEARAARLAQLRAAAVGASVLIITTVAVGLVNGSAEVDEVAPASFVATTTTDAGEAVPSP